MDQGPNVVPPGLQVPAHALRRPGARGPGAQCSVTRRSGALTTFPVGDLLGTPPARPPWALPGLVLWLDASIAERLRALSEQMADLGCDMEFLGGFGPMVQQGRLLIETARIARTWAQEIEGEAK